MSRAAALEVERVDFVTIPTRDEERARSFYHETLGLPLDANNPREVATSNVTLVFWNPESDGLEFTANQGGIALRVADVAAARASWRRRASSSPAPTTAASATWGSSRTPTATG